MGPTLIVWDWTNFIASISLAWHFDFIGSDHLTAACAILVSDLIWQINNILLGIFWYQLAILMDWVQALTPERQEELPLCSGDISTEEKGRDENQTNSDQSCNFISLIIIGPTLLICDCANFIILHCSPLQWWSEAHLALSSSQSKLLCRVYTEAKFSGSHHLALFFNQNRPHSPHFSKIYVQSHHIHREMLKMKENQVGTWTISPLTDLLFDLVTMIELQAELCFQL